MINIGEDALKALAVAKERYPNLRICQIIATATGKTDPFYVEDKDLAYDLWCYVSDPLYPVKKEKKS